MLLHSWSFFLGFLVFLLLYHSLRRAPQNLLLLLGSYLFVAAFDWRFLGMLWAYTLVNYLGARLIGRASGRARRGWLLATLCLDAGGLAVFKYYDFFMTSAAQLLGTLGLAAHPHTLGLLLPLGISFYTFMSIGYCVDVYLGKIKAEGNLLHMALFLGYFPLITAGPIERAGRLLSQFKSHRLVDAKTVLSGGFLFLMGLVRKVAIADTLVARVDKAFAHPGDLGSFELAVSLFMYFLVLYCDFSGYTDMARGISRLLGIELSHNFQQPYFSVNIADFWRRWHMSLSYWLRDYIYIPLGGSRVPMLSIFRNYMITMLLCGLWHGPSWTYVCWGGLQGLALSVLRLWRPLGRRLSPPAWLRPMSTTLAWLLTMLVTALGWIIFRAPDMGVAASYVQGLAALRGGVELGLLKLPALATALFLLLELPQFRSGRHTAILSWPRPLAAAAIVAFLLIAALAPSPAEQKAFVYLQF
jgi:D-alanyl-lipoteichoic acid acyltransferase DltB (MBOAT superfamily)